MSAVMTPEDDSYKPSVSFDPPPQTSETPEFDLPPRLPEKDQSFWWSMLGFSAGIPLIFVHIGLSMLNSGESIHSSSRIMFWPLINVGLATFSILKLRRIKALGYSAPAWTDFVFFFIFLVVGVVVQAVLAIALYAYRNGGIRLVPFM
jgi:hypothetical protein